MGFFDNKETASQKEAKTEEARLSEQVTELEAQITAVYEQIGKEYFESNPEYPLSDNMDVHFKEIFEKKSKIQELTDEIRTLTGITTCKHCGGDVKVTDTFCPNCGERIISEIKISPVGGRCPNCGNEIKPEQRFCSICGTKVTISEEFQADLESEKTKVLPPKEKEAAPTDLEEPIPDVKKSDVKDLEDALWKSMSTEMKNPEPSEKNRRKCPHCGEELEEGMLFCIYCGEPVDDVAEKSAKATSSSEIAYCTNCGKPLEPDDEFCINCGQKRAQ